MSEESSKRPRCCLVIGASASIGPPVLSKMSEAFSTVFATYRRHKPHIKQANIKLAKMDITSSASRDELVGTLVEDVGKIHSVIVLSGIIKGTALSDYSDDAAQQVMDTNFTGPSLLVRDLLPHIEQNGRIVFVSSIAAERGSFDPVYAASKGAIIPFAKSLARAHGYKFSTNVLLPGPIEDSRMVNDMDEAVQSKHRQASPSKSFLDTGHFASVLVDLCSPHWIHMNGETIRLNGGSYV